MAKFSNLEGAKPENTKVSTVYEKPIKNVLWDWLTHFDEAGRLRIRGRAKLEQKDANVFRGDFLITSSVLHIYLEGGVRLAETLNSRYILIDKEEDI